VAIERLAAECSIPVSVVADQFSHVYVVARSTGALVGVAVLEAHGEVALLRAGARPMRLPGSFSRLPSPPRSIGRAVGATWWISRSL
jgi:hypothetical protein